ncbi:MAG: hypothetical protein ACMUIG_06085 [Thermoplasmatota archaeon]
MSERMFGNLSSASMCVGLIIMFISTISIISYAGLEAPAAGNWAKFDRTSGIGPMDYTLKADFDPAGFEYELTAEPGDSGGIISGFGQNVSIGPVRKTYPEVRGEFLENMGILYNSYKDKTYVYKILMDNVPDDADVDWDPNVRPYAYLNVSLHSDLIPWWLENGKTKITLTVTYIDNDLAGLVDPALEDNFRIILRNYRIKSKIYDDETGDFKDRSNDILIHESDREITLRNIGDSVDFDVEVQFPEGTSVAGLYVDISAGLVDYWGRGEYSTLTGNANTINVYPMKTSYLVRGLGLPLALPLALLAVVIGAASAVVNLIRNRRGRKPMLSLIIPGLIIAILAPVWFYTGMNAAVDLLSEKLSGAEEGLSFGPGFYICIAGVIFYVISLVLAVIGRFARGKEGEKEKEVESDKLVFKSVDAGPGNNGGQTAGPFRFKQIDPDGSGAEAGPPNR